jgi:alpha-beta hydrolase superfamily lysophospholipase
MEAIPRLIAISLFCIVGLLTEAASARTQAKASMKRSDLFRSLPLTKFYDTPDPLPPGNPGDLIRSTSFDEYDLPPEVNAIRFIYHSQTAAGADVPVSGVILFPDSKPPAEGWPIIAWAHSWTGVARSCAPSLARNLQHGPFLAMYVHLGYAVVATDYAGLGTASRSAFADISSNASDVIYSVAAARRAMLQLGPHWIAMGTDEGGMAVIGVAELESGLHDPNYLGSIAISRLGDMQNLYASPSALSYKMPLLLAYGIKTAFPQFNVSDMLMPGATSLYDKISQSCDEGGNQSEASANAMLKPGWKTNSFVQKYFERNRLGLRPAGVPLLVIGSEADPSIAETAKIVTRLCKEGARVQFEELPESDPGRVIGDSARDQMAWIQSRFANAAPRDNCSAQH